MFTPIELECRLGYRWSVSGIISSDTTGRLNGPDKRPFTLLGLSPPTPDC